MKRFLNSLLRSRGYTLTPHPVPSWVVLRDHLMHLFERLGIDCVLDVGAHRGDYGVFLRRSGYEGSIVSFEPAAKNFEALRRAAGNDPKWSTFNYALGDEESRLPLNVTAETVFTSFLTPDAEISERFRGMVQIDHTEVVEVKQLDTVFDQVTAGLGSPRVFLKVDTQGYDLRVLKGASRSLRHIRGLQSEVAVQGIYEGVTGYLEAIARMTDMGFDITNLVPVQTHPDDLRVIEFDCVMARRPEAAPAQDRAERPLTAS